MFDGCVGSIENIEFISDPAAGTRIGTTEPVAAAIDFAGCGSDVETVSENKLPRGRERHTDLVPGAIPTKIELVISRTPDAAAKDLSVEVLFSDPLVVVTGKSNPLARRRKIEFFELMDEPWTIQPTDNFFGSLVPDAFRSLGLSPPRLTVATTHLTCVATWSKADVFSRSYRAIRDAYHDQSVTRITACRTSERSPSGCDFYPCRSVAESARASVH